MRTKSEEKTADQFLNELLDHQYEVEEYLAVLRRCKTPKDIAQNVIQPLLLSGKMYEEDATKEAYYMPFARFVENENKVHIARATLFDHVSVVAAKVKKTMKKDENAARLKKHENGCEANVIVNHNGYLEAKVVIRFITINKELVKLILPVLKYLVGHLSIVDERNFDARGTLPRGVQCYEIECDAANLPAILDEMEKAANGEDIRLRYMSDYVDQDNLTIGEVREIAKQDK